MPVEVLRPEVFIVAVTRERVVDNRQQRVRQGYDRLLLAAPRRYPVVVRRQIRVLATTGSVRGFDQRCAQPDVSLSRLASHAFTGALIVTWAQADPRGQMFEGWEAAQIGSDLRYHDLSRPPTEARNRIHPFHHVLDRAYSLRDLDPEALDQLVYAVQVRELLSEQEAVMR